MKGTVSTGAIRYDDVRDGPITLSAEDALLFDKQRKALEKLLADKRVVAKYKLEVIFGKARSTTNPTPGAVTFWASGAKLHGGGDDKLYQCPGKRLGRSNCEALLASEFNAGGTVVCPYCGTLWQPGEVVGEIFLNLTMRHWAEALYKWYRLCEYNADIYLKHAPEDIRAVSLAQAAKATWKGSQKLESTRTRRVRHIYPLRNIIKDTSAGADLLQRIYAFLVA